MKNIYWTKLVLIRGPVLELLDVFEIKESQIQSVRAVLGIEENVHVNRYVLRKKILIYVQERQLQIDDLFKLN